MAKKKTDETEETAGVTAEEAAEETTLEASAPEETSVEAAAEEIEEVAAASAETEAIEASAEESKSAPKGKRAEKIGVVSSDKMTNTVVVRVDRLVKHPIYRKYVKKRKKFMAHDETGAKIGDKVRIVETRPLSARKRWRVVEIIQKAEL